MRVQRSLSRSVPVARTRWTHTTSKPENVSSRPGVHALTLSASTTVDNHGISDKPPVRATAHVHMARGKWPICSECRRKLQTQYQWRCPYTSCRAWLYGTDNPPFIPKRQRESSTA